MADKSSIQPNFFILGAQKAGTTSLYQILKKHPEVYLTEPKETRFFNLYFDKGLPWYHQNYYSHVKTGHKIVGEATPHYLSDPQVPSRLKEAYGTELKLVVMVRQPVRRAYSHYQMMKKLAMNNKSFKERVARGFSDQLRLEKDGHIKSNYLHEGSYVEHLSRYLDIFPGSSIHLMVMEDMKDNFESEISKLCDFLSIKPTNEMLEPQVSNSGGLPANKKLMLLYSSRSLLRWVNRIIGPETRLRKKLKQFLTKPVGNLSSDEVSALTELYFPQEKKELEALLGRTLDNW
jgi:hypothetical protein